MSEAGEYDWDDEDDGDYDLDDIPEYADDPRYPTCPTCNHPKYDCWCSHNFEWQMTYEEE